MSVPASGQEPIVSTSMISPGDLTVVVVAVAIVVSFVLVMRSFIRSAERLEASDNQSGDTGGSPRKGH